MRWVACEGEPSVLGEREGHCACALGLAGAAGEWILCVGGYSDGELCGSLIVADARTLPRLAWTTAHSSSLLACDGATLTPVGTAAYLFGGLDGSLERVDRLLKVTLDVQPEAHEAPLVDVQSVDCTTGTAPSPRWRHAAGGTADGGRERLFIFGGDTDESSEAGDLYCLDLASMVWSRLAENPSPRPPPRFLATSLVFVTGSVFVLYGGAFFDCRRDQKSLSDVWTFCTTSLQWTRVSAGDALPPSNGHGGALLAPGTVAFVGGKDFAEGCDEPRLVTLDKRTSRWATGYGVVSSGPGEAPHWRYMPAVVATSAGILLLAGQCRHPHPVEAYLLQAP